MDVYSNAFNFNAHLSGAVDARTGQYSCLIRLGTLYPQGPLNVSREIVLTFSMLNTQAASSYGAGWHLSNTEFDVGTSRLTLITGEQFQTQGLPSVGRTLVIKDHKLNDLVVRRVAESTLHVIHKDGTVEILGRPSSSGPYKINAIQFENGERLSFRYLGGGPLERVLDHSGKELLLLTYIGGVLAMADYLVEGARYARTRFAYGNNNQLLSVTAPYDRTEPPGTAAYGFVYRSPFRNGLIAISEMRSPVGATDVLSYEENGHQYAGGEYIPRVVSWRRTPGASQPSMTKTYRYSSGLNFTGFPFNGGFRAGEDNLYLVAGNYDYWTEETSIDIANQDAVLSTTRTTFNKFHLMAEEQVRREGSWVTTTIAYNVIPGKLFPDQPANLQLPRQVTKRFHLSAVDPGRDEVQVFETDDYGNELSRTESSGIRTEYTYYPVAGDGSNCPADPHGLFERYLKQERLVPANSSVAPRITGHTHTSLVAEGGSYFVLALLTSRTGAASALNTYHNEVGNLALHGRLKESTTTIDALAQITGFSYSLSGDTLVETQRLNGREAGQWLESVRTMSLTNRRLLSESQNGSAGLSMTFDVSGRLITETAAAGKPQKADRHYAYHFAVPGKLAHTVTTDSLGKKAITYFDGLGRQVATAELDALGNERPIASRAYDALGQLVEEARIDYLTDGQRLLKTRYTYNRWGNSSRTIEAGGRVQVDEYDPLLNLQVTGVEEGGLLETTLNEHAEPVKTVRVSNAGERFELESWTYDGLGRVLTKVDARKTTTKYTYDLFDRVASTLQTPSDNTAPRERIIGYPLGTIESWVSSISVDGIGLGSRSYDSLGRLISQARGGAPAATWEYRTNTVNSAVAVTPRGDRVFQSYDDELHVLTQQLLPGHPPLVFQYDPTLGVLLSSDVSGRKHELVYDSYGHPEKEVQRVDGAVLTSHYVYSPSGRMLQHTSVDGKNTVFNYDAAGRFYELKNGLISIRQHYDTHGRPSRQVSVHLRTSVMTSIVYDTLGREANRRIEENGVLLQQITTTYHPDGLLASRCILDVNDQLLIGEFYTYDGYSRLTEYCCDGLEYPRDWLGREITRQRFSYDSLDNMIEVNSHFLDGTQDTSERSFTSVDPTRLSKVTHVNPVQDRTLVYDAAGNLLQVAQGRTFEFNPFGQLSGVQTDTFTNTYQYDAESRQVLVTRDSERPVVLAYNGGQLDTLVEGNTMLRYIRGDAQVVARSGGVDGTEQYVTDAAGSVRGVFGGGQPHARRHYSPYGDGRPLLKDGKDRTLAEMQVPAFNGERLDIPVNLYHLGNGRRAYDPELMIFLSPDPLSPFGEGGTNSYAYCFGNPINVIDPSGLVPSWVPWVLGTGGLALSIVTFGLAIAPVLAAATLGTVASLTAATLGLGSGVLGVAALGVAESAAGDEKDGLIAGLEWSSIGLGVAALGFGGVSAVKGALKPVAPLSRAVPAHRNLIELRRLGGDNSLTYSAGGTFTGVNSGGSGYNFSTSSALKSFVGITDHADLITKVSRSTIGVLEFSVGLTNLGLGVFGRLNPSYELATLLPPPPDHRRNDSVSLNREVRERISVLRRSVMNELY